MLVRRRNSAGMLGVRLLKAVYKWQRFLGGNFFVFMSRLSLEWQYKIPPTVKDTRFPKRGVDGGIYSKLQKKHLTDFENPANLFWTLIFT